uniref:C2H2-type domain-containing protein n=1 Tax=Dicentrarchus labrax TaxID=13489 RepID=A0A8C4GZF3_DICLA
SAPADPRRLGYRSSAGSKAADFQVTRSGAGRTDGVLCNEGTCRSRRQSTTHLSVADDHVGHPSHVGQFPQQQNVFPHTVNKSLDCSFCGERFLSREDLIVHRATHTGESPIPCSYCGKSFVNKTTLTIHMRIHTGEKPYFPCNLCNKKFHSRCRLGDHMRVHTGEKPFPCSMCPKKFRINQSLKLHILRIHKDQVNSSETNGDLAWTKPLEVIEDNREDLISSSKDPAHAINHNKVHKEHPLRPQSNSQSLTLRHTNTLSHPAAPGGGNGRPYTCPYCTKCFTYPSHQRRHLLRHTGVRLHPCQFCDKSFLTPSELTVHTRTHTGERPFGCAQCGKRFARSGNLRAHQRDVHMGKRPFACTECRIAPLFLHNCAYTAHSSQTFISTVVN